MKPEWKDAPDWATHLAQDSDGCWRWFETRPVENSKGYWEPEHGTDRHDYAVVDDWDHTLEVRPDE